MSYLKLLPNEQDIAEAESIYSAFEGRFGMKHRREDYIFALTLAAMRKRRHDEYKAKIIKELHNGTDT